ncbi:MAG: hypothetical protein ACFFBD_13325 [Candidatus Hodarchaeota archaeon]
MRVHLGKYLKVVLLTLGLVHLLISPIISESSLPESEQTQITFTVNETFDLGSIQSLSYQFPLKLNWVGSHARVRVQGGIVTGSIPSSLDIKVVIDDLETQKNYPKTNGLQTQYTFHSTNEYVLAVPPPIHPNLEGVQTLHNFTVEISFNFLSSAEGTGLIYQIIFETFTPSPLEFSKAQPLVLLQDQFNWEIRLWSFGRYFFNTSLIIPLSVPQNVSLQATIEFSGLTLESWQLSIGQGTKELQVRDKSTLEGILVFDPSLPCELQLSVDPPQVSEVKMVGIKLKVQGLILPTPEPSGSNPHSLDPVSEKRINEGVVFIQLGMVILPLLTYYRVRRPSLKSNREEENK